MTCEPLTVRQVVDQIITMITKVPEAIDWPVHILNMEDDDEPEQPWDALVTHVEHDCFAEEQGHVVSLLAWRSGSMRESP